MKMDKVIKSSRLALFFCGGIVLIAGLTLILVWWPAVVVIFKGVVGMGLALSGLALLYMMKE